MRYLLLVLALVGCSNGVDELSNFTDARFRNINTEITSENEKLRVRLNELENRIRYFELLPKWQDECDWFKQHKKYTTAIVYHNPSSKSAPPYCQLHSPGKPVIFITFDEIDIIRNHCE